MFTITAEYIITFNTLIYQSVPVIGLFLESSQACVSLDQTKFHYKVLPFLSIPGHAGKGSPISHVHVVLPNVVHNK